MKRTVKTALKIAVTVGLLAIVLRSADTDSILRAAAKMGGDALLAGFAILMTLTAMHAVRWRLVIRALGAGLTFLRTWRYALLGVFFSQLLPTSIGGDVVRVWKLHRAGPSLQASFNSVLIDRLAALVAAVLISALGLPLIADLFPQPALRYVLLGLLLGVAGGFLLLATATRFAIVNRLVAALVGDRLGRFFGNVVADAAKVFLAWPILGAVMTLSCLMQVGVSTVIWVLAKDAGASVELLTCVVVVPMVILVSMLPVSIAGWGVREGAMLVALGAAGVDGGVAVAVSVVFGLLQAASGVPGAVAWLHERRHS